MQLLDIILFAVTIPLSAVLAEHRRRRALLWITIGIFAFGLVMAPMFIRGTTGALLMMAVGLSLMGLTYGPLGTVLSELFPTPVRYTGSSLAFNFAGILGASLAPYIATYLARELWAAIRRLLPLDVGGPYAHRAAGDPGNERRGPGDVQGVNFTSA